MTRIFLLREPPRVLSRNDTGIASNGELRPLSHLSPTGFDDDPIALFNTFLHRRIGMDLDDGVPVKLSEPTDLPVLRVKEPGRPGTRYENIRILLVELRCAYRTFRGFPGLRGGIVSHLFEGRGVELELPRGGREAPLFVLVIFHLSPDVVHLLEILPGDAHGMEDIIEGLLEVVPPVLALADPVGEVVDHLVVRAAL